MGAAVRDFRRERARAVCIFRFDGETFRFDKSRLGRGRQINFAAKMDFRFDIYTARFADKRFADVCDFVYFAVAFSDVAFVSEADLHKGLNLIAQEQ